MIRALTLVYLSLFVFLLSPPVISVLAADTGVEAPRLYAADTLDVTAETTIKDLFSTAMTTLGPLGVLGWYCYYVTSKILPEKDRLVQAEREAFTEALKSEREDNKRALDELLKRYDAAQATVMQMLQSCGRLKE